MAVKTGKVNSTPFTNTLDNKLLTLLKMQALQLMLLALATVASAAPGDRGSYTVSGLGARKQAILNAGGNTLDIAIAMLETETMTTDYAYGTCLLAMCGRVTDQRTTGDNKQNDAANFGLFKQNWGMLRVCGSRGGFVGQSESEWNNGAKLKYAYSF